MSHRNMKVYIKYYTYTLQKPDNYVIKIDSIYIYIYIYILINKLVLSNKYFNTINVNNGCGAPV